MDALLTIASIRFVGHGLMKKKQGSAVCCSYINNKKSLPSQASVFTAARLNASVIRIVGPGSSFITSGMSWKTYIPKVLRATTLNPENLTLNPKMLNL